jgi:hypothetical protein
LIMLPGLLLSHSQAIAANQISFTATADLSASSDRLNGQLSLTLRSSEPIYDTLVFVRAQEDKLLLGEIAYWEPDSAHRLEIEIPSNHTYPGNYHLLVEVTFRDKAGANHGIAMALEYPSGESADTRAESSSQAFPVGVSLLQDQITWQLPQEDLSDIRLTVTTEPSWVMPEEQIPHAPRIQLIESEERPAIKNWRYQQKARLEWVQDNRHDSRVQDWTMATDARGNWLRASSPVATPPWRNIVWLSVIAALFAIAGVVVAVMQHGRNPEQSRRPLIPGLEEWSGALIVAALFIWTLAHTAPSLWLSPTWSTGGDVASHVFYAREFMEWLPTGKISGWLPESFAGFPAFTFYFPLPFTLASLLQFVVGQQVAFKIVSMLPALLLPAATYLLCYAWRLRVPSRLLAAAGATGFIIGDATSIWGGNLLAQLSGEFSYSWGFFFVLLFWAALAISLQRGGRWWILAAVLEACVALSHGYALLIAGFGAFIYLVVSNTPWRHLRIILQVHLLAFLLIGFWLIPLIENLAWTIPNDTSTAVENWRVLWPESLWPLALGWLPLMLLLWRQPPGKVYGIFFLMGICMLGLIGFIGAGQAGLADLRFFPFAQWALAVASGASLGWMLLRLSPSAALPFTIAIVFALATWWEPRLARVEGWSEWNLSGYETKAMWPHYQATARSNAGPLDGPRLVFEHDPANGDIGSTRAMEALPMFGSRPALEGLYMESAITGPFIYQLQAEISERPSSPLSRYPSTSHSSEKMVGHLNEFFTDRVILRSAEKKAIFNADDRFQLLAEHGPLHTYELRELQTQLVETLDIPVVSHDRERWMDHAFRRFVLDFPYKERHAYLAEGQSLPVNNLLDDSARVEVTTFSRERLVFETNRPGQPHLIRMSFNPKWSSRGGETIYLVEPAFMLIYPTSTTVEIGYIWSRGDWLGLALTVLGIFALLTAIRSRALLNPSVLERILSVQPRFFSLFLAACSLVILAGWWMDPERVYQRGHTSLQLGETATAAEMFDQAFDGRRTPAHRAEALFWSARSWQMANHLAEASDRYEQLTSEYQESYWYPESLFRRIEIYHQQEKTKSTIALLRRLKDEAPTSQWTTQAASLLSIPQEPD